MKRNVIALLSIFAAVSTVGWKLTSHPETSAGLKQISLIQSSEHSQRGPTIALRGIRIRLSPSDFGYTTQATSAIPQIAVVTE